MIYDYNYHYGGMHLIWWFVWLIILFWVFISPYNIPGQKAKKGNALEILKKRFASGQIKLEEYQEMKKILEA